MKTINVPFCVGIAYIACLVGMAIADVGEMPKTSEPYSPWLPFEVAFVLGAPFAVGFIAALDSKKDGQ